MILPAQQKSSIINRSRFVPVVVVFKSIGITPVYEFYLHGREMKLHLFKKMCKKMPPIEIVELQN